MEVGQIVVPDTAGASNDSRKFAAEMEDLVRQKGIPGRWYFHFPTSWPRIKTFDRQ